MVRLAALPAAYAAGLAGTALAARAHAGSDVVRGEIESNGLPSLVTYCNHIDDIAQESPAGFRDLTIGRSTRGE